MLPIHVDGALFSVGDGHGVQGDGEVCVTAIETALEGTFELIVRKDLEFTLPRAETPTHRITMGMDPSLDNAATLGPDLMEAARAAVTDMIELLAARHGMRPVEAYMLSSVCGDLRISEIVDQPNWVVSFYFPRVVLE